MTTIIVYMDEVGQWRWRMQRSNKIIADSVEGYSRKSAAKRSVMRMVGALQIYGPIPGFSDWVDEDNESKVVI